MVKPDETTLKRVDLSLIIPTHNTRDLIIGCVNSILAHSDGLRCEIIVVDDASTDGTFERVRSLFPQIQVIFNPISLGYGGAANRGLLVADGRHMAVLNSDIEVVADALTKLVALLDSHPEVGAVGPKLINPDRTLQKSVSRYPSVIANFARLVVPDTLLTNPTALKWVRRLADHFHLNLGRLAEEPTAPIAVECMMGAFFMMRREVYAAIGGFDAEGFYMFAEEGDWFFRMQQAGWKAYYVPYATVIHYGGQTVSRFQHRYVIQQYMSFLHFYEKHFSTSTVFLYKLLLTPVFVIRAISYWLLALLSKKDRLELLRQFETNVTIVRLFHNPQLRTQNILREMKFRYIPMME
jgi:GT2 family glycosyltransferase